MQSTPRQGTETTYIHYIITYAANAIHTPPGDGNRQARNRCQQAKQMQSTPRQGTETPASRPTKAKCCNAIHTPPGDGNVVAKLIEYQAVGMQSTPRQGTKTWHSLPAKALTAQCNPHPARGRKRGTPCQRKH